MNIAKSLYIGTLELTHPNGHEQITKPSHKLLNINKIGPPILVRAHGSETMKDKGENALIESLKKKSGCVKHPDWLFRLNLI